VKGDESEGGDCYEVMRTAQDEVNQEDSEQVDGTKKGAAIGKVMHM